MIKNIHFTNFKSLKNIRLKPSNLNLCFGMNGMGKSSLLQALLLLRQSKLNGVLKDKGLWLNNKELLSLGTGKDVFYQKAGKGELMQLKLQSEKNIKFTWCFKFDATSDILPLSDFKIEPAGDYSLLDEFSIFNNNFQYLSAEHYGPQKAYEKSESEVSQNKSIGVKGEFAVHYLSVHGNDEKLKFDNLKHPKSTSDFLINQTNSWLGEISPGVKLNPEDIKGTNLIRLGIQFETKSEFTNEFSPINVGFGILYVMPIIISLLKSLPGSILLIENPESHLHPQGQSAIGRLMSLVAQNGVQIFCESHSDHIINGARVAVKEKLIDKSNLAIYYFDRNINDDEHKTRITEIFIDDKGELSNYPSGLLDEWSNLLMKLV
ncbi:MAG: DUF3696 domain-containing protein [Bacteroidia bacterium]|nr:DUF3696 domain-containing protein [Bacteroidia bacterium]